MQIYADNAATTKMSRTAIDAMLPYMETYYGNPSSLHTVGQQAAEALMTARQTVAACLGCQPREITFTSGGSEADNQALISAARQKAGQSGHLFRPGWRLCRFHPSALRKSGHPR